MQDMKRKLLVTLSVLYIFSLSLAYADDVNVFETPSEIFVDTGLIKVSVWKKELLGAQITIEEEGGYYTKVFPCFNFGSNSSDGFAAGEKGRNNEYSIFLGEPQKADIRDEKDRVQIKLDFPYSVIRYRKGKISPPPPADDVFSAAIEILVYKRKPRVDIVAIQKINEDLYVHIAFFQQFIFKPFGQILFGTAPWLKAILPNPWSKLRFMYKTPEGKIRFVESSYEEKPPYKNLHEAEGYNDFWVMLSKDKRSVLVYSPSWQRYASLGYNRKVVPDSSIFFNGPRDLSAGRLVSIVKDTTLGAGKPVLKLEKGEYVSEIRMLFLPYYKDISRYVKAYQGLVEANDETF